MKTHIPLCSLSHNKITKVYCLSLTFYYMEVDQFVLYDYDIIIILSLYNIIVGGGCKWKSRCGCVDSGNEIVIVLRFISRSFLVFNVLDKRHTIYPFSGCYYYWSWSKQAGSGRALPYPTLPYLASLQLILDLFLHFRVPTNNFSICVITTILFGHMYIQTEEDFTNNNQFNRLFRGKPVKNWRLRKSNEQFTCCLYKNIFNTSFIL